MKKLLLATFLTAVIVGLIAFVFSAAAMMRTVQDTHSTALERALGDAP